MRPLSLLLALAACGAPDADPRADTALPQRDGLDDHLDALAGIADAHDGHRAVGSSGYDASVAYVLEVLDRLGWDAREEAFDVPSWEPGTTSVQTPDGALDATPLQWSPGGRVTAPAVIVDAVLPPGDRPDTSTSGCEPDDFDGFPRGAVAVVQRGTCPFADKARHAEQAGAAAVLIANEGQPGRTDVFEGSLDPAAVPAVPVVAVPAAVLTALGGGDEVTVDSSASVRVIASTNVLADRGDGDGPRVIVGAHLDSVPEGPGINDNGTGVALTLDLAARAPIPPSDVGLQLALWGAEEVGLVGSLHHVRALEQASQDAIVAYLNFDMVGSPNPARFVYDGDGSELGLPPGLPAPRGNAAIEALFRDHFDGRGLDTEPTAYDGRSDYLGFALAGVPTGGLFTGAETFKPSTWDDRFPGEGGAPFDPCYHQPCDVRGNVTATVHAEMVAATVDVVARLRTTPTGTARRFTLRDARAVPPIVAGGCHHAPPLR